MPALPKSAKRQIRRAVEQKLTAHPFELGKPLRYSLRGARRLRVGDYRVIYRIEPPDVVLVVKIGGPSSRLYSGHERTPWTTLGMSPPKIILSAAGASERCRSSAE
ncbi:MAG: type II toxin-antitoxin system RelE/ParE family toxin [Thermoanaerobaculia bacterium]